jgi:ribosomal-protein-alanine N-acetyltransferase
MPATRSSRLRLRRPTGADLPVFLAYRNHPDNLRFQPIAPMPQADAMRFLQAQCERADDADACWIMFAIERRADGRMIGEVGIYMDAASGRTGDIGWSLDRAFQGQGYATEAARLLLGYAFDERGLERVTASMHAQNLRSIRLCERLGMALEMTTAGERHYALHAGDWRRAAPAMA